MLRQIYMIGFVSLMSFGVYAQNQHVGIGTATPNDKAILDISSSDKGVLPPRLTTQQRDALLFPGTANTALNGLLIYNVDTKKFNFWDNDTWAEISTSLDPSGIKWISGNQDPPPAALSASNGDYYLSSLNGNYYQMVNGAWPTTATGNLIGPQASGFKQEVQGAEFTVPANNSAVPYVYQEFTIPRIILTDAIFVATTSPLPVGVFIASVSIPKDGVVRVKFMNKLNQDLLVPQKIYRFGVINKP